ncbi:hypothetical protein AB0G04_37850 [Actinoplanes sp. NPDC023801]|uniref:hypothetical protein n=1 Tax=Actinoplanes sp. NPDC023801 TaxID=3154595 RepID=UPI0034022C80
MRADTPREQTIFFFAGERAGLRKPRSALAGFRALLAGGALLTALTVVLRPALDVRGCSNYGGNGNGTAFHDQIWDLNYPLLLLVWMSSVVVEQLHPATWNGRRAGPIIARALLAVMIAVIVSCGAAFKLLLLCR